MAQISRPFQIAFVVVDPMRRDTVDARELEAWCRENLASYKVPEIHVVESLPLTATGKVKKDELAKALEAQRP